jgi:hypothetical protein
MEAECSLESLVSAHKITPSHNSKYYNRCNHCSDNLRTHTSIIVFRTLRSSGSEGSQAVPALPSDKGSVKVKTSEWLEAVA